MDNTISIYNKLFNILNELNGVGQNGYNSFHKYKYTKQEDIIDAIKPLLIKNKLLITNEVIEEETIEVMVGASKGVLCKVTLEFTITDLDSMAQIKQKYRGHGMDVGDKGIYKAMTGAEKYFYMKNFLISSGNDDPEYNGVEKIQTNIKGGNGKGGSVNNKSNSNSNVSHSNTTNNNVNHNNVNINNSSNKPSNNINQNNFKGNPRPINVLEAKSQQKNKEQATQIKVPLEFMNDNTVEDTEPKIDVRLQKLLFEACNQEKDIVANAIRKLGYTSTAQIKVSEYKRVLELIKAQVKLLK